MPEDTIQKKWELYSERRPQGICFFFIGYPKEGKLCQRCHKEWRAHVGEKPAWTQKKKVRAVGTGSGHLG
jgi:hypothetical protein